MRGAAATGSPTDFNYATGRGAPGLGLIHLGARWYDSRLSHFVSPDTIIPQTSNPQAFNRYAYGLNNPVKYIDPSGHVVCDPDAGCEGPPTSGSGGDYACVEGYGCFDIMHLGFADPRQFWTRMKQEWRRANRLGLDGFTISLFNPSAANSSLTKEYYIDAGADQGELEGIAMGIYQDFALNFETFQLFVSNFANEDLPSDYLGMVAALRHQDPVTIISQLGRVTYQSNEERAQYHTVIPNAASNFDFTPRVRTAVGEHWAYGQHYTRYEWQNVSWPTELQVTPINNTDKWTTVSVSPLYAPGFVPRDVSRVLAQLVGVK